MSTGKLPLDVECPRCKAAIGNPCRTSGGYVSGTHRARWKQIGISSPSFDDLMSNRADQNKRELDNMQRYKQERYGKKE